MTSISSPDDLQAPFDAAVVIVTVLRPDLLRAVRSVYEQDIEGRVQILVGIDKPLGDPAILDTLERERPERFALTVLNLGYSTSKQNGGLYPARDGGALRTILSFAANSRYVAYLDDDNWLAPNHLSSLRRAIRGKGWAYSLRWLVDQPTMRPLAVDEWHSVGPGRGSFRDTLGGFCDPNTLMVDKFQCSAALHYWSYGTLEFKAGDRGFFQALRGEAPGGGTGEASVYYVIRRKNILWLHLQAAGIQPGELAVAE